MLPLPDGLVRTNTQLHGAAGAAWLRRLPAIVDQCARRWGLALGPPFAPLTYNYVAPARRANGTPVVLKACFPDRDCRAGAEALRIFAGRGAVRLLAADLEWSVLLLERLAPGRALSSVRDDVAATAIAAGVMGQLWRPPPVGHAFPSVADWVAGFRRLRAKFGGTGPLPPRPVERAEALFSDLLASQAATVLLHGDLHHDNILAAGRAAWRAIDPKGVVGEPAYEVGALLRNPARVLDAPHPERVLARRADQLAEALGFDRARLRDWAYAQAVLSAVWCLEDSGYVPSQALRWIELLATLPA
jgi:streptomycin 6-kinase